MTTYRQDPDAVLDYKVDWSAWLPTGDTITTSTFAADDGITLTLESNDDTTATVWISGGVAGQKYSVTNHVETLGGRATDRSFTLQVQEQ